ncbi:uncharacterized protein DNG_06245 [Cephalotrichum gorgonifer]|uniref:Uncharacterized protein n=1 Tax=Cephalotrichum gorgonifer TaxID=2041049 RepID=A0AAE8MZM3_9PEZI|nr:uncharacterized protein DNG_06245 [Cephalotrichum gorgonifer]
MPRFAVSTLALLAISALGYVSILGLTERNGWRELMKKGAEQKPILLATGEVLRTEYTGVEGVDGMLRILVRFFYSVVVAERPELSVFSVYFIGQIFSLHAILVLEGLRAGNKWTAVYLPAFWGMAYQMVPFGITFPIYCAASLLLSPLSKTSKSTPARTKLEALSIDPARLSTMTTAMLLGLAVPSVLPCLTSPLISSDRRQIYIAIWQIFPICVSMSHHVLTLFVRILGLAPESSSQSAAKKVRCARTTYHQIITLSALAHLGTIAFIAFPGFRELLVGQSAEPITFDNVFHAMSVVNPHQVATIAEGTQTLLQYDMYFGCAAALAWVMSLSYAGAGSSVSAAVGAAVKLALRSLLVGPGGATLWAFWDRDEEALAGVEGPKKRA